MRKLISVLLFLIPVICFSQQVVNHADSYLKVKDTIGMGSGGSDIGIVNILNLGIKGDSTDESTRIQAVFDSLYALRRKVIVYVPANKIFGVGRPNPAVQRGIRIPPGISIYGQNTKFVLFGNAEFFKMTADALASNVITANTTIQDSVLTFAATTGFVVGGTYYLRIGQAAYDAREPDHFGYFTLKAVTSTTVTLDRPCGYALTVSAVTDTGQKRLIRLDNMCENQFIEGINMVSSGTGSNVAEAGLWLQYGRNIKLRNIRSTNANTGTFIAQFIENLDGNGIYCDGSIRQNNVASFGRGFGSLAECNGVILTNVYAEKFAYLGGTIEAKNYNVVFNNVHIKNNLWDSTRPVFSTAGSTDFEVHGLYLEGYDIGQLRTGNAIFGKVKIWGLHLDENCKVQWNDNDGVSIFDGFEYKKSNGVVSMYKRVQRTVTGQYVVNGTRIVDLPEGYYNRMDVYSTTGNTGFSGMFFTSTGTSSCSITSVTAGKRVRGNYGTGLQMGIKLGVNDLNFAQPKTMQYFTTSAMPSGQYWKLLIDMFECIDSTTVGLTEPDASTDFNYDAITMGKAKITTDNVLDSVLRFNGPVILNKLNVGTNGTDSTLVMSNGEVKKAAPAAAAITNAVLWVYNSVATSQTTTFTDNSYVTANDATTHYYNVQANALVTAISSATLTVTVQFTDPASTSRTLTFCNMATTTAAVSATGSTNFPAMGGLPIKANTTVTVTYTFAGTSISYVPSFTITRLL